MQCKDFIEYITRVRNYQKWDLMTQMDVHSVHRTQPTLTYMPPGTAQQSYTSGLDA